MKKLFSSLLLVVLLLQVFSAAVYAEPGAPIGSCPKSFELHMAMNHDGDHMHKHVGTDTDRNGDGWICVKFVSVDSNIHVHIDNNLPPK